MARYRKIDVRIWNDKKFRSLNDQAKLAFLCILTHPDTNQLGFIRTRSVSLSFELGWQIDAMSNAIQILNEMGMVMVDENAGLMFIPNFLKYNPPNGVNGAKSWAGILDLLPECNLLTKSLILIKPFIDRLSEGVKAGVPKDIIDAIDNAINDGIREPSRIQEQEQEQELFSDTDVSLVKSSEVACDDSETQKIETTREACPYEKIADVYNEVLGDRLGHCMKLTPTRKTNVRARWLEAKKEGWFEADPTGVEFFRRYFIHVSGSSFLMGNKKPRLGESTAWRASFDFLFKSENFTKIREGQYHR